MKILIIMGTRPEAIKFAPLVKLLATDPYFDLRICITGQHKQMLQQVLDFFVITPHYDLSLMKHDQTLFDVSAAALTGMKPVLDDCKPDLVFVQGDTTTAFMGALASFYEKIPIAHLEAGLRSGDNLSPFPEEANRKLTATIADYHFAPTNRAKAALAKENITKNVWMVGNTVVDALLLGLENLKNRRIDFKNEFEYLDFDKPIVLITAHRRESFGKPFEDICDAILETRSRHPLVQFIYPVHFNPNVREVVNRKLSSTKGIFLTEPLDYPRLIWIMEKSTIILTDSGGIQEEAPALGKPVLVLRDVTERLEGIEAGTAKLVGTNKADIVASLNALIENENGLYDQMAKAVNPYGDGTTAQQVIHILKSLE
ncbi:MAG: UDP-N-acetylglucosamine 2-epimerase (non-hydrolyzing) [Ferruginibacter sp.]